MPSEIVSNSPWFLRQPAPAGTQRRLRLYCFCYAGGNAVSYLPWQALLNPAIEVCAVQLPGRGARMGEAPMATLTAVIEGIAHAMGRQSRLPFAFFGHSLGALLAFELARYCKRYFLPMPAHLFVSGCDAPQFRDPPKDLHLLSDDDLIEELRNYNGTPPDILAHRELMDLVLPIVRADFSLVETYRYRASPLLNVPMTVLAGTTDERSSQDQVDGWAREGAAGCDIRWFEGDHFFIHSQRDAVMACLNDALEKLLQPSETLV